MLKYIAVATHRPGEQVMMISQIIMAINFFSLLSWYMNGVPTCWYETRRNASPY
jgi:hypothetical protein